MSEIVKSTYIASNAVLALALRYVVFYGPSENSSLLAGLIWFVGSIGFTTRLNSWKEMGFVE